MTTDTAPTAESSSMAADILGTPGPGVASPDVVAAHDALHTASDALRVAVQHLHEGEDEAWRRYAAEADDAVARMEAELAMSAAKLRADRAESRDALRAALEEVARTWRARADEIRIQTRLGEMEARDAGLVALEDLDAAGHRVATLIHTLGRDAQELRSDVVDHARQVIDDVRGAVAGLVLVARPDGDRVSRGDAGDG